MSKLYNVVGVKRFKMAATIKDVAKRAGVSIATVSNVINGSKRVSPELKGKVQKAIEELGYQPNPFGRALRKGESSTIALLIPDRSNPFYAQIAWGVEEQARRYGYALITCHTDEDPGLEEFYVSSLLHRRVAGFIVAPTSAGRDTLAPILRRGVPLILVDRVIEDLPVDQVSSDNESGAYMAIRYLLQLGHRNIGVLSGVEGISTTQDRIRGYKKAFQESGLPLDESLIAPGCSQIEEGATAAESLLLNGEVTAIFSINNMMTLGALHSLKRLGLRCPEDVSLVGFDDSEWAAVMTPGLTVVAQQSYELGYLAGALLFRRLKRRHKPPKPRTVKLRTKLIIRESTAEPRRALSEKLAAKGSSVVANL